MLLQEANQLPVGSDILKCFIPHEFVIRFNPFIVVFNVAGCLQDKFLLKTFQWWENVLTVTNTRISFPKYCQSCWIRKLINSTNQNSKPSRNAVGENTPYLNVEGFLVILTNQHLKLFLLVIITSC